MAKVVTGYSWSNEQITPALLNQMWTSSTFNSSAVDDSTTALSGGAVIVKDAGITTAKIADDNVTFAKLADVLDSDAMTGASATKLATSESIKAYTDARAADPARVYNSLVHSTVSATTIQNTTGRPLWVSFTFRTDNNLHYLYGDISPNSDMSSHTRIGQSTIYSDSTEESAIQVMVIVPSGWYWKYTYSATAPITELVHSSFKL